MHSVILMFFVTMLAFVQLPEPTVSKDAVSVHKVMRGTMPLREMASGSITSIDPPKAVVSLPLKRRDALRIGQAASIQIKPAKVIKGKLTQIDKSATGETLMAEIELAEALPSGVLVGTQVDSLIEVGELADVVFFERPAQARPNSEAIIFVIEADGQHAKRMKVRYGQQSGALIEIVSGLSAGDRVIVTDMSAWATHERVLLK